MNPMGYETIDSSTHDQKEQPLTQVKNRHVLICQGLPDLKELLQGPLGCARCAREGKRSMGEVTLKWW